jgi:hypothetical protein
MALDESEARKQWDAINLELTREVTRLVDRHLLTESQKDKLWSDLRSSEERAYAHLQTTTQRQPSTADRLKAGVRARMWLATVIEGAGTEHERAVAIRRRIVDLEKNLGVFEKPTVLWPGAEIDPEYAARMEHLGDQLRLKVVRESAAGHSGYLLRLVDGDWVAVWLDPRSEMMDFVVGEGDPESDITALLSNPDVDDASAPLDVDRPRAAQPNDIATEAARTHQKQIVGVAIGVRAFSLRFPEGMELEGTVFRNGAGRTMMRVFWEQG